MEERVLYNISKPVIQENSPSVAHIYGQYNRYESVLIIANRSGLSAIKNAIERALQGENGICVGTELMSADGVLYNLNIRLDDSDWQRDSWQNALLPYVNDSEVE